MMYQSLFLLVAFLGWEVTGLCSICSSGAVGAPDKPFPSGILKMGTSIPSLTCSTLDALISKLPSATCSSVTSQIESYVDVAKYCNCSGASSSTTSAPSTCHFCPSGFTPSKNLVVTAALNASGFGNFSTCGAVQDFLSNVVSQQWCKLLVVEQICCPQDVGSITAQNQTMAPSMAAMPTMAPAKGNMTKKTMSPTKAPTSTSTGGKMTKSAAAGSMMNVMAQGTLFMVGAASWLML